MNQTAKSLKVRQNFVAQKEELLKPVKAFGERLHFLTSIPATATVASSSIGYTNALVEMVQQSRELVLMHLVHQIQRLGLAQELGPIVIKVLLEAVANGGEAPVPVP